MRRTLRSAWDARKRRAFARDAIVFHLETWSRRRLAPEAKREADRLRSALGLTDLLVLHGSAFERDGGATLVCGPPATGKTTTLPRLEADGRGRLVEDGILLVGRSTTGAWLLVTTGTLPVLLRASRIGRWLRHLVMLGSRDVPLPDPEAFRRHHRLRAKALGLAPRLAFALAIASRRHPATPAEIRSIPLRSLVVLSHPRTRLSCFLLPAAGGLTILDHTRLFPLSGVAFAEIEIGTSQRQSLRSLVSALEAS